MQQFIKHKDIQIIFPLFMLLNISFYEIIILHYINESKKIKFQ